METLPTDILEIIIDKLLQEDNNLSQLYKFISGESNIPRERLEEIKIYQVCGYNKKYIDEVLEIWPDISLSMNEGDYMKYIDNVHTLDLSYTKVTDVSMLGRVHRLDLSCTQVTDVSMLGGVHTLYLNGTQVTDVSMLGGVHTLNLRFTKVTDVSM